MPIKPDAALRGRFLLSQEADEGEKLIARSQAQRLIARFERFRTVVLDFEGVEEIGQGFVDEVFRVFRLAHPGTELHIDPYATRC